VVGRVGLEIQNSTWGASPNVSAEQHEIIKVIYPGNLREKPDEVTGFRIYNSMDKGGFFRLVTFI
jgi:hypothetical protein